MTYLFDVIRQYMVSLKRYHALRGMIRDQSLTTYFQPVISLQEGSPLGYEVLNRPPASSLFPNTEAFYDFIGHTDQVFAFERASRDLSFNRFCAALTRSDKPRDTVIFINIHPQVLLDTNYRSGETLQLLSRYGLSPKQVVFELTEKQAVHDYVEFERILYHYRAQGFRVAIDDAGSGYNSLKAIVSLKPEFIKLDKSLIRNVHQCPNQQRIVKLLQEFAAESGTHIIAEGIEAREEFVFLQQEGIEYGQGYAIGRPATELQTASLPVCEKTSM
ncbi:EAL domain/GGDEF domain protein [Paenibacillus algicola]|uniref:EAL domain/GGDEF domain protein n=1 Tax=Paenibacillus algicola TaxID=2565926 RepID=A0A4V1G3L5_9BACL|nr:MULTISPECIES: EAL domain-containing protein [Paenibacillus]QCT01614.1 EAL domain/GGDEF domain protein [Paenibacillus algicola]